ncbi:MAG: hypothetical protein ABIK13_00395 [Patescibacteria group bacterium]
MKKIGLLTVVCSDFSVISLQIVEGLMNALVLSAGVGLIDEFWLENRLKMVIQKMMDDAVAKRGRKDFAQCRFGDDEAD